MTPLELNAIFDHAAAAADSQIYRAASERKEETNLELGRRFLGISTLSKRQNDQAVAAFMKAIRESPAYGALVNDSVMKPLEALQAARRPLTASAVRQAKFALDVAGSIAKGRALCDAGALPAGHGAAFGQLAIVRGLDVGTAEGERAALREYLADLCERNESAMTRLDDMPAERASNIRRLFARSDPPMTGEGGFIRAAIDRAIDEGGGRPDFRTLASAWRDAHAEDLAVLEHVSEGVLTALAHDAGGENILAALREALPTIGPEGTEALAAHLYQSGAPVATQEERLTAIRGFMADAVGSDAARATMTQNGLPESFALAVGHNPEVRSLALERLAAGPVGVPSLEAVKAAVAQAAQDFTRTHLDELRRFAALEAAPPAGLVLTRPLGDAVRPAMPRLINAMLAEKALLGELLSDNEPQPSTKESLERFARLGEALNSATHAVKGDFGAADAEAALQDAVRVLLALEGVPQERIPEMMARALSKFGALSSDLSSVLGAFQSPSARKLGATGPALLSEGFSMLRTLEGHARGLIGLMTPAQRDATGLSVFNDPPQGANARKISAERAAFIERNFEADRPLDEIGEGVRGFFRDRGLTLPDMRPELREAAAAEAAQRGGRLLAEAAGGALLAELIPAGTQHSGPKSPAFMERFGALLAEHGARPEELDLTSAARALREGVSKFAEAALSEGRRVDPDAVRAEGLRILDAQLRGLCETLDAVGAEPRSDLLEGLSAAGLSDVRRAVARVGAAGVDALRSESQKIADAADALRKLAQPCMTPSQIVSVLRSIADAYRWSKTKVPTVEDVRALACLGAAAAQFGDAERRAVAEALEGPGAQRTAQALRLALSSAKPENAAHAATLLTLMDDIHAMVRPESGVRPSEAGPEITHPSQVPGGDEGAYGPMTSIAGDVFPASGEFLATHFRTGSPALWDRLNGYAARITDEIAGSRRIRLDFLGNAPSSWIALAAPAVGAFVRREGALPDARQLWTILTEGRLGKPPASVKDFRTLFEALVARYAKSLGALVKLDDADAMNAAQMSLNSVATWGVPFPAALEMLDSKDAFTLERIHPNTKLGALDHVRPEGAYGLVADFARMESGSSFTITDAEGVERRFEAHAIPERENKAGRAEFQEIIGLWRGITRSEAQLRRVAQCFSQTPRVIVRGLSAGFPGAAMIEHGLYEVSGRRLDDGNVEVVVRTGAKAPLDCRMRFVIDAAGTDEMTDLSIARRRPLAGS